MPAHVLDMTARPHLPEVFRLLEHCDASLRQAGLAAELCDDVRLVLEELMVNMVEHGHAPPAEPGTIALQVRRLADAVLIDLHDDGRPFDPLQAQPPALTGDLADAEQVGGLGIHLVRSLVSDLEYRRGPQGNYLRIRFDATDRTEPCP